MVHSAVLKKKNFLDENDELVFKLLISYNEDRQISSLIDLNINSTEEYPVEDKYIIIESIGEYYLPLSTTNWGPTKNYAKFILRLVDLSPQKAV